MIQAVLLIYIVEWLLSFYFSNTWEIELQIKLFINAVLANALLIETRRRSLLLRSLLALITIGLWSDFIDYSLWQWSEQTINLSLVSFVIFIFWLLHTIERQYPERIDEINHDNINILALHPRSTLEVIKALFGLPASSICIVSQGYVWSFRRKSGLFEKNLYSDDLLKRHLIIDTGIEVNDKLLNELDKLIGIKRFPYIKCVWTVRHVLNLLGNHYMITSLFDYIPGVYFIKILK